MIRLAQAISSPEVASLDQLIPSEGDLPPGDYGWLFAKMFLTLIAFAIVLGVSVWFLRKLIQQRLQKGTGVQAIHILEKKMISPKTMLYLVEVESQKILIAESHLEVRRIQALGIVKE